MATRAFLLPFGIILSALTSTAEGVVQPQAQRAGPGSGIVPSPTTEPAVARSRAESDKPEDRLHAIYPSGEDLFRFVIRRGEGGQVFADHESHYSHSSHYSHRSHYSSQ